MTSNDTSFETDARREKPPAYEKVVSDFGAISETSKAPAGREPADNEAFIAVMGPTGSGKTTFINLATQSDKKLQVGHAITSCTDTVDFAEPFELDGRRVVLLDTPGFDDTNKGQLEILRIIASTLEKQFREGSKLHGLIYVHRISDTRVGGVAKSNFRIFKKICGEDSLKNVIIATTMWSKVSEVEGQNRVNQLVSLDDFFKPALEKKAQMMHHKDDTVQSARNIVRKILDNHPLPLALQEELVNDAKPIEQTAASQEAEGNVAALKAHYEQLLREQKDEFQEAIKNRDEETRKELEEEMAKAQAQIDGLRAEQESHAAAYRELQEQIYSVKMQAADDRQKALETRLEEQRRAEQDRQRAEQDRQKTLEARLEEQRRAEEDRRRLEQERQRALEKRLEAERKAERDRHQAEQDRQRAFEKHLEEERKAMADRLALEQRRVEEQRRAMEKRLEEQRRAEQDRQRMLEKSLEEERKAMAERLVLERRSAEERQKMIEKYLEEQQRAEQDRQKAEQDRQRATEKRLEEERKVLVERLAAEQRSAEERQKTMERHLEEQRKVEQDRQRVFEKHLEEERKAMADRLALEQKKVEEHQKALEDLKKQKRPILGVDWAWRRK